MIQWLVDNLLPITIVAPDEQGLIIRRGQYIRTVDPGLYWTFPLVDEVQTITVTPQVVDLPDQVIEIQGKPYAVSVSVEYWVENAKKAMLHVQDYDEAIQNRTMELVLKYEANMVLVEDEISTIAEKWGLVVSNIHLNQKASCRVFRLIS